MKHGFAKVMLGVYLVSTFLFCAVLPKENTSVQRVWERVRPDAGALGMYCVSSAYPNFNLADGTRLNAEHGQTREADAETRDSEELRQIGTKEETGKVSNLIATEEKQPEPVVFGTEPAVLIVHTHATESYLPSSVGNYHKKGKQNTVRDVGETLAETLEANGIGVVHDQTLHDNPSYNQSYNRSYETIEKLLQKYPTIVCVIDLHRDAIASDSPAATVSVGGKTCAKYSYVVSNAVETYRSNLKFIQALNRTAEKSCSGFTGRILERGYRYNQGLSDKYLLLEIGYNRNDIADCRNTAAYFGKILADTLKAGY